MLNKQFLYICLSLLVVSLCSSCQSNHIDTKQLIGLNKTSVVKLTFQCSERTKHGEIVILTWNQNGSIVSHLYASLEDALNASETLLNKDIWGIDFRKRFSVFSSEEDFILLHFSNGLVTEAEYKKWQHK